MKKHWKKSMNSVIYNPPTRRWRNKCVSWIYNLPFTVYGEVRLLGTEDHKYEWCAHNFKIPMQLFSNSNYLTHEHTDGIDYFNSKKTYETPEEAATDCEKVLKEILEDAESYLLEALEKFE